MGNLLEATSPTTDGFDEAPVASKGAPVDVTFRTFALAAVAARTAQGTGDSVETRFLRAHLDAVVRGGDATWLNELAAYVRRPAASDEPLVALARSMGLTMLEVLVVALCSAVEEDVMVGRALAYAQAPLGGSRPTLALLATALADAATAAARLPELLISGAAVDSGLFTVLGEPAPLPERAVAVPLQLSLALGGRDGSWPGMTIGRGALPAVPLPPSFEEEATRQAKGLVSDPRTVLVIRTGSRTEGRRLAEVVAAAMERRPVFVETEKIHGLGPWAILRRLLPVFCLDLAPGERKLLPPLPQYRGPVLALCGPDGSVEAASGPVMSWSVPVPGRAEREALWTSALANAPLARELAQDHRHGAGRIFHLGLLARHRASVYGRACPDREDVVDAAWTGEGAGLDALAQPVRQAVPDEALVTAEPLRDQLDLLLRRCRCRDGLADGLGASLTARYQPGVRALFVGPSGTGKTLAASWLATKLGLPLYRVDLAAVTSKYIGETEKNLAQLLARAEQAEVVLLFDEADSLFGKRTDIREANDRFANAQTNYLLQRIEGFDGISILTSNSRSRFDDAFSRRLDMIVEFATPGPDERRSLWLSHLGTHHRLQPRDINQLAATADLCGGDIRNAVLTAAVIAHEQQRPIAFEDVVVGVAGEFRKLGRQMPIDLRRGTT